MWRFGFEGWDIDQADHDLDDLECTLETLRELVVW